MTSDTLAEQFKQYAQLPPEQRAILEVLAVHNGYAGPMLIGKCLSDLGVKDGTGKVFKPVTLAPPLEALHALHLVEKDSKQANYRCSRWFIEPLTRKLAEETRTFRKLADSVERQAPVRGGYYRYGKAEDCLREARIRFHRREYQWANECLKIGR
jgi:hypothetical protein